MSEAPDRRIGGETRQWGEHQREEARREEARYRDTLVREALTAGNRALVRDDYVAVATLLRDRLLPTLGVDRQALGRFDAALADSYLAWDWAAVRRVLDDPGRWVAGAARLDQTDAVAEQRLRAQGYAPPSTQTVRTLERAFRSVESIAVAQGVLPGELSQSSAVSGHTLGLGVKWQRWDYTTPDEVSIVNSDIHPPFHVALGTPGHGKTTSLDALVEDAYAAGAKIVDLLDFSELENAMYDIPSQREDLIERREALGLPGTWADHPDYERPDVELLHPLCRGLCEAALPFDTEAAAFTIRPFTIPPAEVDHDALVAQFPHLSETREKVLRETMESLGDQPDWSLDDLRKAILDSGADQGVVSRLLSGIRTVDDRGFIRARSESEHTIDWERIFTDTDTITVFSCSLMEQEAHKLMVTGYLLNAIHEERYPDNPEVDDEGNPVETSDYPRALAVMRELQDAAPGQRKRQSAQGAKGALYNYLLSRMQLLSEKRRHTDLGILGDTQQWKQLAAGVRENVDRVLMFKNQPGTARQVFDQLTGSQQRRYLGRIESFEVGDCCAIGSQHISTGQSFLMPIEFAPPMCHHLDTDDEAVPDGWHARAEYLDCETLRPSPFTLDGGTVADPEAEKYRQTPVSFHEFEEACLTEDVADAAVKARVYDAYLAWVDEHGGDLRKRTSFGRWVRAFFPTDDYPTTTKRTDDGDKKAYRNIRLTDTGEEYAAAGVDLDVETMDP